MTQAIGQTDASRLPRADPAREKQLMEHRSALRFAPEMAEIRKPGAFGCRIGGAVA